MKAEIISLIIWLALRITWAFIDANNNNQIPRKPKLLGDGLQGDIVSAIVQCFIIFGDLFIFFNGKIPYTKELIGAVILFIAIGWIFFDLSYNFFRHGIKLDHVGTTSWTDKPFHKFKNPFTVQLIAKLTSLSIGLIVYFI